MLSIWREPAAGPGSRPGCRPAGRRRGRTRCGALATEPKAMAGRRRWRGCGRGSRRASVNVDGAVAISSSDHVRVEAHPLAVAARRRRRRRPAGGGPRASRKSMPMSRGCAATRRGSTRARRPTRPRRVASATSAGPTAVARGPGCAARPRCPAARPRLPAGPAGGPRRVAPALATQLAAVLPAIDRAGGRGRDTLGPGLGGSFGHGGPSSHSRRAPPRPDRASAAAVTGTVVPRVDLPPTVRRWPRRRRNTARSVPHSGTIPPVGPHPERTGTGPHRRSVDSLSRRSGHGRG